MNKSFTVGLKKKTETDIQTLLHVAISDVTNKVNLIWNICYAPQFFHLRKKQKLRQMRWLSKFGCIFRPTLLLLKVDIFWKIHFQIIHFRKILRLRSISGFFQNFHYGHHQYICILSTLFITGVYLSVN